MSIRKSILIRVRISFLLILLVAFSVIYRIMDIQILEGEMWMERAIGLKEKTVKATRGTIYSSDDQILATSLPYYRVAFDPTISKQETFDDNIDSLALLLAGFFKDKTAAKYAETLKADRRQGRQYRILSNDLITHTQKKQLDTFPIFRLGQHRGGIIYEKIERRYKPYDDLARRTVGFINENDDGEVISGRGLEFSFDEQLAGMDGKALYKQIAGGYWRPVNDETQIKPDNGLDIITTLDLGLQDTIHDILENELIKQQANYGCVVLMEVSTGEIKAMVNLGRNSEGNYTENNNFAVSELGLAEPGSTFKLMSMAAVFEKAKTLLPSDTVDTGRGVYKFFDNAEMRDVASYGKISVQQVFEKSSNIGMSKLVYKYFRKKPEEFTDYLKKFGLTQPIGVQMLGEAIPYVKTPEDSTWSGSTLPWMSIGYELKLAPIHTLAFYNAIANNGKMLQPLLVKKAVYANRTVEEFEAKVLNPKICSDKTLGIIRSMLRGVVVRGTAKGIGKELEFDIAGKTGTAEKVRNKEYTEDHYTSFAGYFPADNPKYSCIVVVDDPQDKDERYGGQVAAPVFREISDVVYRRKIFNKPDEQGQKPKRKSLPVIRAGFKDDLRYLCKEFEVKNYGLPSEMKKINWVRTSVKGDTVLWKTNEALPETIPSVVGMRLRDAVYLLENAGLKVRTEGSGRVKTQSFPPGRAVPKGKTIWLKLE